MTRQLPAIPQPTLYSQYAHTIHTFSTTFKQTIAKKLQFNDRFLLAIGHYSTTQF